jgi:stage V sporulation protein B
VPQKPQLLRNLLRPALPAVLMGALVFGCRWALERVLGSDVSRVILCGVPVMVGVVAYFLGVVVFKAITREDCQLLPKGEKIAKLLHL